MASVTRRVSTRQTRSAATTQSSASTKPATALSPKPPRSKAAKQTTKKTPAKATKPQVLRARTTGSKVSKQKKKPTKTTPRKPASATKPAPKARAKPPRARKRKEKEALGRLVDEIPESNIEMHLHVRVINKINKTEEEARGDTPKAAAGPDSDNASSNDGWYDDSADNDDNEDNSNVAYKHMGAAEVEHQNAHEEDYPPAEPHKDSSSPQPVITSSVVRLGDPGDDDKEAEAQMDRMLAYSLDVITSAPLPLADLGDITARSEPPAADTSA